MEDNFRSRILQAVNEGDLDYILKVGLGAVEQLFQIAQSGLPPSAKPASIMLRQLDLLASLSRAELDELYQAGNGDNVADYAKVLLALDNRVAFKVEAPTTDLLVRLLEYPDKRLVQAADSALSQATDPIYYERLCRLAVEQAGDSRLEELALKSGYLPREPYNRALFLFLTGQWEAYQALDFDYSLLRSAYKLENDKIRRRILTKVRAIGNVELTDILKSPQNALASHEWQLLLDLLVKNQEWSKLWNFAQTAPPYWSVQALNKLAVCDWIPTNEAEQVGMHDLIQLAQRCYQTNPPLGRLLNLKMVLKKYAQDVTVEIAISPNGKFLASNDQNGKLILWHLPSGELIVEGTELDRINHLVFSPDSRYLLGMGYTDLDSTTVATTYCGWIFEMPTGQLVKTVRDLPISISHQYAFVGDGNYLVSGPYSLQIWSFPDLNLVKSISNSKAVSTSSFATANNLLVDISTGDQIRFWQLPEVKLINTITNTGNGFSSVMLSPDGQLVGTVGYEEWRIWDNTGRLLQTFSKESGYGATLVFSPNNEYVAISLSMSIELRNVQTGELVCDIKTPEVIINDCLSFSPDSSMLIGSSYQVMRLWQVSDGKELAVIKHKGSYIVRMQVSLDGQIIVTTSPGKIKIWTSNLVRLANLPLEQTTIADLAWLQKTVKWRNIMGLERHWLKFMSVLLGYKWRHELEITDVPDFDVREFDIELEG